MFAERYLEGRRALVTASSRNLGAAIAAALAARGATVCVQYHASEDAAAALVRDLEATTGRGHTAVGGDVSDPDSIRRMVAEAIERLGGGIDVLINNAGPFSMTPYVELSEEEWDRIWDTNVKACYLTCRLVARGMRERGWGRIVNVSAGSAYLRNHSIYGLAKHAVIFLTEELAVELGPEVTVNAVAPGQIAESAADIAAHDPTFVERAIRHTPLGRLVTRGEVAELVAVMLSPAFDMITGVTIPVDGGWRFNRF
jgi:NAD(P)-dependent dehydrogenase (short-subunit alcohol dehydrogenase family)